LELNGSVGEFGPVAGIPILGERRRRSYLKAT